jgi:hypothetical protein
MLLKAARLDRCPNPAAVFAARKSTVSASVRGRVSFGMIFTPVKQNILLRGY